MNDSKNVFTSGVHRDPGFDYFEDARAMRRQFQISLGVIVLLAAAIAAVGLNLCGDWPMRGGFAALVPHATAPADSTVRPLSRT